MIYRRQLTAGGRPNHSAAGAEADCTRQTAAAHFSKPLPGTSTTAPLPAIRTVLEAEAVEAAAGRAASNHADAAVDAGRATLMAPVSGPGPVVQAPPPPMPGQHHAVVEQRVVDVARNAAEGLAAHAVALLASFAPLVRASKRRLELLAQTPDETDPKFVIAMHGEIAKTLGLTVAAIERLATVQSTLSSRPNATTTVRVERGAEKLTDEEVRRRADIVAARLRARGIDLELGSDSVPTSPPIDVSPEVA